MQTLDNIKDRYKKYCDDLFLSDGFSKLSDPLLVDIDWLIKRLESLERAISVSLNRTDIFSEEEAKQIMKKSLSEKEIFFFDYETEKHKFFENQNLNE